MAHTLEHYTMTVYVSQVWEIFRLLLLLPGEYH